TWCWSDQSAIRTLADDLGVEMWAQFRQGQALIDEPGGPPKRVDVTSPAQAEFRLVGGAQLLCDRLADRLEPESIKLGTSVEAISDSGGDGLAISINGPGPIETTLYPDAAIVAIPPRLALDRIQFRPGLPSDLLAIMASTPTWMSRAVKCIAAYDHAFWRDAGLCGLALSEVGPLVEVHDGGTADGSTAALWGFLSADHAFRDLDGAARADQVLDQLAGWFGPEALGPLAYFERDWSQDPNTADQHVGFGPGDIGFGHEALGQSLWNGRLVWAGAETETVGGGHMEGAIRSGQRAARLVLSAAPGNRSRP
ncbi:MAG: flavin monoamine oxidase family protein, partial [Pseudonocardiaceae bacterium]